MNIEIYNESNSLKIVIDGAVSYISKQRILELSVIDNSIIRLDTGEGPLNNIFLNHESVSEPATVSAEELRDALNDMLQSGGMTGFATEKNQQTELEYLSKMQKVIEELKKTVEGINSKTMYLPVMEDNTNGNIVYKGFAVPGAKTGDPVWAVLRVSDNKDIVSYQWADGNMNFDNIWDERTKLNYF